MKVYQRIATQLSSIENCQKTGNTYWEDRHNEVLNKIEQEVLPSGSGFDSGCTIDREKSERNKVVINAPYHPMNENGYYESWKHYTITITPDLVLDFNFTILEGDNEEENDEDFNLDYIGDKFGYILSMEVPNSIDYSMITPKD